ncbi:MAG TPA: PadR family transcriptional regulator [Candidatus Angelobacter sp.]
MAVQQISKRRSKRDALSEIEACVLGLIKVEGPATPYAIRKVFLDSPSPQWSGSAGTIYPLMERLRRRRLIRSEHFRTGKRHGKKIWLTAAGARALKRWLATPVPNWVAGVPPDPLRTRVRFLAACSRRMQRDFLASAYRQAREHLRAIESDCKRKRKARPGFEYLMALGAFLSMQSRCEFLRQAARMLDMRLARDVDKRKG